MVRKLLSFLFLFLLPLPGSQQALAIHHYTVEGDFLLANNWESLNQIRCFDFEQFSFAVPVISACLGEKRPPLNLQDKWLSLMATKEGDDLGIPLRPLTPALARELLERLHGARLFADSFPFEQSFTYAGFSLYQLVDFVVAQKLAGVSINESYLESPYQSAEEKRAELQRFGSYVRSKGLELNLQGSDTSRTTVLRLLEKARLVGVSKVKVYVRKEGWLKKEIIPQAIAELKEASSLAKAARVSLLIEQHEDLKSQEIIDIVGAVNAALGEQVVTLVFDTANSISAYEKPLHALAVQAPLIRAAHLKDARITTVVDRAYPHDPRVGWAQLGTRSGDGDVNLIKHIFDLLMLGVKDFACQESNGFTEIAYRFADEEAHGDVFIPARGPNYSETNFSELATIIINEQRAAVRQYTYVRQLFANLKAIALEALSAEEGRLWQEKSLP